MMKSVADEADFPDATASLWIDAYPSLKSIFLPGSTESEKVACLLRLFQMALQPEDIEEQIVTSDGQPRS